MIESCAVSIVAKILECFHTFIYYLYNIVIICAHIRYYKYIFHITANIQDVTRFYLKHFMNLKVLTVRNDINYIRKVTKVNRFSIIEIDDLLNSNIIFREILRT